MKKLNQKDQFPSHQFLQDKNEIDDHLLDDKCDEESQDLLNKYFENQKLLNSYDLSKIDSLLHPIIIFLGQKLQTQSQKNDQKVSFQNNKNEITIIKPIEYNFDNVLNQQNINTNICNYSQNDDGRFIIQMEQDKIQLENKHQTSNIQFQNAKSSLNGKQLADIKQIGQFTVYSKLEEPKIWKLSDQFYMSQASLQQKYPFLKKKSKLHNLFSTKRTEERIKTKIWIDDGLDSQYWNLKDGIQTLFVDLPFHLLNSIIGVPISVINTVQFSEQIKQEIQTIRMKRNPINLQEFYKEQIIKKKSQQFSLKQTLMNKIKQLKWDNDIYQLISHLKLYLQIECYLEYFDQEDLKNKYQESLNIIKMEFIGNFIVENFKQKILNTSEIIDLKKYITDCLYFLSKYNLPIHQDQMQRIFYIVNNNFNNFSKEKKIYCNDNNIRRDHYFWKISHYSSKLTCFANLFEIFKQCLYNGKFGLRVLLSTKEDVEIQIKSQCLTINKKYKTIYRMFEEVKQKVKENNEKQLSSKQDLQEDENDDGGIFGDCCMRFKCFVYISNYFFLYFLKGIVYINLFLRLVSIIYLTFILFIGFFLLPLILPFFMLLMFYSMVIYDHSNPKRLNIPSITPLVFILFINPILGMCKIVYSIIRMMIYAIKNIRNYTTVLPQRIKNILTFLIIKLFGQVPIKDSRYCTLINNSNSNNKNKNDIIKQSDLPINTKDNQIQNIPKQSIDQKIKLYNLSFEQIKTLIDLEINKIYKQEIQKSIQYYVQSQKEEQQKLISKLFKYLPFPKNQIQSEFDEKINTFQKDLDLIFSDQFKVQYEIQFETGSYLFYQEEDLKIIDQNIQSYLKEISNTEKGKLYYVWKSSKIQKKNFEQLSHFFLNKIFSKYLPMNQYQTIIEALTRSNNFNVSQDQQISSINSYLQKVFFQQPDLFKNQEINIENQIELFYNSQKDQIYYF